MTERLSVQHQDRSSTNPQLDYAPASNGSFCTG